MLSKIRLPWWQSFYIIALLSALILPVSATDAEDLCAYKYVYSPFTPWFKAWPNVTGGYGSNDTTHLACWWYADCIYSQAPSTRQSQFASTSLVMGLLPIFLKDIVWPERRTAYVKEPQKWYTEVVVRGLGLNPVPIGKAITHKVVLSPVVSTFVTLLLPVAVLLSYGALAVMEVFSKGSCLGCYVPVFIWGWYLCALIPAAIQVYASRRMGNKSVRKSSTSQQEEPIIPAPSESDNIPGGDDSIIVQISWGIYYAAGTLLFSSIMLVTVLELFLWVVVSAAATASSKLLAYRMCGYLTAPREGSEE